MGRKNLGIERSRIETVRVEIGPISRTDFRVQPSYSSILELRAMLGFERWLSANKGLPLGSVIDHLCGIDGVEASRMEIMFD